MNQVKRKTKYEEGKVRKKGQNFSLFEYLRVVCGPFAWRGKLLESCWKVVGELLLVCVCRANDNT